MHLAGEVVAHLGQVHRPQVRVEHDVRGPVAVGQRGGGGVGGADLGRLDEGCLGERPVAAVGRPAPADVALVRRGVRHEHHDVVRAARGDLVLEHPGVGGLRGAGGQHRRGQHDLVVGEVDAVLRARKTGGRVLAVEVQPHLLGRGVPQDVGGRHVRDRVVRGPVARDDRVGRVLGERSLQRVAVGEADAAGCVVGCVVEVEPPERAAHPADRAADGREDQFVGRVVPQRALVERRPHVPVGREPGGSGRGDSRCQ